MPLPSGNRSGEGLEGNARRLFHTRAVEDAASNYVLSAGDQVELSVAGVKELNLSLRVSQNGDVFLPLVGPVRVSGMTERQAASEIHDVLDRSYFVDPQVTLRVSEFRGAPVAVMGAVAKPGIYYLEGFDQTVGDMLTEAGGLASDAGTKIHFSPGPHGTRERLEAFQRLEIDLTRIYEGRSAAELAIPVRAGDRIVVPKAGEIYVDGWVESSGAYPLTRGLTLAEAISEAGGFHYAARRGAVSLLRADEKKKLTIDAEETERVFLQSGDRVHVGANPLRVLPWGLYRFVTSIFRIGVGGQVPVRSEGSE